VWCVLLSPHVLLDVMIKLISIYLSMMGSLGPTMEGQGEAALGRSMMVNLDFFRYCCRQVS